MNAAALKELYGRKARALTRRPAFARGTAQAWIRLESGLACEIEHEGGRLRSDQPESEGGDGTGPEPGQLMRASLGAGLAMGYRIWAARLDVPIDRIEVDVSCDYDARGPMGVTPDAPVGWQRVRFDVTITSAAPPDAVRAVVETADRLNPMLANLASSVERVHHLKIVAAP